MKTTVRKHSRKTKGGRTDVKRHTRRISHTVSFHRRKIRLKGAYVDFAHLKAEYVAAGYSVPSPGMTLRHGADMEYILQNSDGTREHHRLYDLGDIFRIESHIDQVSPEKNPLGHIEKDVVAPEIDHDLRTHNFNDTQIIYLQKI